MAYNDEADLRLNDCELYGLIQWRLRGLADCMSVDQPPLSTEDLLFNLRRIERLAEKLPEGFGWWRKGTGRRIADWVLGPR